MNEGIKKRLSRENSKKSLNQDVTQKVALENTEQLLPSGEINHVLDVVEQFNKERESSGRYRLISTIKPVFTNVLSDMSGTDLYNTNSNIGSGLEIFTNPIFKEDPFQFELDLTNIQSFTEKRREINGWFGYFDPDIQSDGLCGFYDLEPRRERFSFDTFNGADNWDITITYPHSIDTGHTIINSGLLIIGDVEVEVSKRKMTAFSTFTKHGLQNGDTVRISDLGGGLDGEYRVIVTGLEDGTFKDHYFVLDINQDIDTVVIGANTRLRRIVNGQESEYYFRKFKKIPVIDSDIIRKNDYEIFNINFAKNIFKDPQYQYISNTDIDVENITDNLGRPISEIYYTFLKTDSNNKFTELKSGIDSELVDGVINPNLPDIRQITSLTGQELESGIELDIDSDIFYGDVVEYNKYEVKEKVLAEVKHRFNTTNRETGGNSFALGPRIEGYFYKPHYQVKIREFSNYIEQGDESVVGIPDYAENIGDGRLLWRDFLDIGVSNSSNTPINYPFLNGAHYLYNNITMLMKRQDPFGQYGLLYTGSIPNDEPGEAINDEFRINTTDKIC